MPDTERIIWSWLDNKLKKEGTFPTVEIRHASYRENSNKLILPVSAFSGSQITRASLYYTQGGPSRWTNRVWKEVRGYQEDGIYYFGLPQALVKPEIMFFVSVRDSSGAAASTPVQSLFKVIVDKNNSCYALSSPIAKTYTHQTPLSLIGINKALENLTVEFSKINKSYSLVNPLFLPQGTNQ
jgi:hypothetical protein